MSFRERRAGCRLREAAAFVAPQPANELLHQLGRVVRLASGAGLLDQLAAAGAEAAIYPAVLLICGDTSRLADALNRFDQRVMAVHRGEAVPDLGAALGMADVVADLGDGLAHLAGLLAKVPAETRLAGREVDATLAGLRRALRTLTNPGAQMVAAASAEATEMDCAFAVLAETGATVTTNSAGALVIRGPDSDAPPPRFT